MPAAGGTATRDPQGAVTHGAGPGGTAHLEGDLSCMSPFELLQVLQFLGKSGRLFLRRSPGDEARCRVLPHGLTELECGALRQREAALAFSWWREGSFRFESQPATAADERGEQAEAIPVQEILLDAVRLADEIEARAALVPERGDELELVDREPLRPELAELPAAAETAAFLAERPGATRRDLEAALPFAPVTLGFALARLCELGYVRAHAPAAAGLAAEMGAEIAAEIAGDGEGVVRALIGFDRTSGAAVLRVLSAVHAGLDVPPPNGAVSASGPSFHRSRLPSGRFLSIIALPVARRNRFFLESLVPSLDLVVLLVDDERGEAGEWLRLIRAGLRVVVARSEAYAVAETLAALEPAAMAPGTAP